MTKLTATAQKSTKGRDIRPPREIVDNTKARRAWLAEQLASVLTEPDTDRAKTRIVGTGSYQVVSVWKFVTVEGRERFRGVCQLCGRDQVVDASGAIVLHGYNRPGFGYIVGKCPEVGSKPLQHDDSRTRFWLADFSGKIPAARADEIAAESSFEAAKLAADKSDETDFGFRNDEPEQPERGMWIDHVRVWEITPEHVARYESARAAWTAKYPLHIAKRDAAKAFSEAHNYRQWLADMVTHLEGLLSAGILGSPLTREVVA